jgi:ribose transport system permease protein
VTEGDVATRPSTTRRKSLLSLISRILPVVFETNLWILGILGAIILVFGALNPGAFLSPFNARNVALDTAEILLLVLGETFVLITGGVDLSVGSMLIFSAVIAAKVMTALAGSSADIAAGLYPNDIVAMPIGILLGVSCGVFWGAVNGLIVAKLKIPAIIATLGTLGVVLGFANLLTGGVSVPNVPPRLQLLIGSYNIGGVVPVPVLIAGVAIALMFLLLHRTRFGRYTYAVGSNAEASRRAGIKVDQHLIKVYILCGGLCGVAGVIDLARFDTVTPASHSLDNLNAIAAVAIGGTSLFGGIGTISGGVIAAFIPTVLQNGLVIESVQPYWQQVAVGVIIVGAVYLDQWRRRRFLLGS